MASGASRFAVEIAAWVAGPWAAAELAGTWIATIPTLIGLIALPGAFSTVGDKRQVVVAVPGRVRLLIELVLIAVAISSAFLVWTPIGGIIVAVLAALMLVTGEMVAQQQAARLAIAVQFDSGQVEFTGLSVFQFGKIGRTRRIRSIYATNC